LKVPDFDFQGNEVLIRRQHGDPEDPRPKQPVAKTLDRLLPLSDELIDLVHHYVITARQAARPAKRHPFLLIAHQQGANYGHAMSYSALSKVMRRIRAVAQIELNGLSGHVLRHTTNERLSDQWDVEGVPNAKEEKMRSYMMGWKEGSGTAATYTRRHTERMAREAQLKLQGRRNGGQQWNSGNRNR
jgi:integrase